jgi:hypothetical protein
VLSSGVINRVKVDFLESFRSHQKSMGKRTFRKRGSLPAIPRGHSKPKVGNCNDMNVYCSLGEILCVFFLCHSLDSFGARSQNAELNAARSGPGSQRVQSRKRRRRRVHGKHSRKLFGVDQFLANRSEGTRNRSTRRL